ncbi:MAG TPA: hypothetical protein VEV82_09645, partial [Actinomycetota bacterium]|nr:hypothetical protein [Actinomycetota bacterium]
EKMKPIAARYEAIRQSYVGVIDEENREVLRNRERRLWSEVKNLDEIWPEYLELSSVQITPGLRKDPAPLPTPWPSSTRAKLVWFVQNWAEVWLPTTEEIFAVSTAEERETAARSTAGESELERKHRRSVEANKRMSDSRQRA